MEKWKAKSASHFSIPRRRLPRLRNSSSLSSFSVLPLIRLQKHLAQQLEIRLIDQLRKFLFLRRVPEQNSFTWIDHKTHLPTKVPLAAPGEVIGAKRSELTALNSPARPVKQDDIIPRGTSMQVDGVVLQRPKLPEQGSERGVSTNHRTHLALVRMTNIVSCSGQNMGSVWVLRNVQMRHASLDSIRGINMAVG